jgi:hypothetical protein
MALFWIGLALCRGFLTVSCVRKVFIAAGIAMPLGLVGQSKPVPGHIEQEHPTVQVGNELGKFDAIGSVESIASNSLASHHHSPECLVTPTSFHISGKYPHWFQPEGTAAGGRARPGGDNKFFTVAEFCRNLTGPTAFGLKA